MKKLSHSELSKIHAGTGAKFLALAFIRTVEYAFDQWIALRERKIATALEYYIIERNALAESDFEDQDRG